MAGFLNPDRQSENQERLEALGAGSGAADVEYEQFLKAKEAGHSRFLWRLALLAGNRKS